MRKIMINGNELNPGHTYNGYKLYENANMVEHDGYDIVPRPWRQRLFSWPWKPFKATMRRARFKPMTDVYIVESMKAMFCHPVVAQQIRNECNEPG